MYLFILFFFSFVFLVFSYFYNENCNLDSELMNQDLIAFFSSVGLPDAAHHIQKQVCTTLLYDVTKEALLFN
jgi:hypothetical protein